jgi:hypothetical protein
MSLSNPKILYGIHSVSPYRKSDLMPYGILKVIGSASLALTSDLEQLFAGSNKYAWAAESKTVNTELTMKVKAYPGFLFELFLGASVTENAADAAGAVTTLTNAKGDSVQDAVTGIASISVKAAQKANLKFGKYVMKAVDATHVAIYLLSDIDITRGTDAAYADDTLQIIASVVVASGVDTDIDDIGLKISGGSGTIALVAGDTASFDVKPPSTGSSEIVVGKSTDTFPSFGALILAQKRSTGEMFEINAHNCVAGGLPINLEEQAFSQPELKMTCLYEASLDRVFSIRHLYPENP